MLLVSTVWGANFAIVKASLAQIPPLAFTALRFGIASILLFALVHFREGAGELSGRDWLKLVWLGLVGNTAYQLLFINGLSITTAANSALLVASTPVIIVLLGWALRLERITGRLALGVGLAFSGILLVMVSRGVEVSTRTLRGDLLVLASAVCWSVYTLGVRNVRSDLSPLRITALTLLTGTPGLFLVGLPQISKAEWGDVSPAAWGGLAYASLLALVLAYAIWNTSVRVVGGARTAVYACVTPLVALLVAWPLLGERPTLLQAAGAGLIIGGVLLTRVGARSVKSPSGQAAEVHVSA